MISLRRRLILYLWSALVLVGIAAATFGYIQEAGEADERLDYQMQQIAEFLTAQGFADSAPQAMFPQLDLDLDHDTRDDFVVGVRTASGKLLYSSRPDDPLPPVDWTGFRNLRLAGKLYRLFSATSSGRQILVAQQRETRHAAADADALTALLPILLLIPIFGIVIGAVIRQVLQPLRRLAAEVSQRAPLVTDPLPIVGLPTEIRPLIDALNRMLERQHVALEREQQFVADAAHALRTPLTALQLQADVVDGSCDEAEKSLRLQELRAGIGRAVRLADQLLTLARSQPDQQNIRSRISLKLALQEAYELYAPIAEGRAIDLVLNLPDEASVPGDARHLMLLIGNLLDNALRYTPARAQVLLQAQVTAGSALIEVLDQGPGLPDAELEMVFQRFYRVAGDTSEGGGLGLAVVRGVATTLGGRAWLENRGDRSGLRACIELPCQPLIEPASDHSDSPISDS